MAILIKIAALLFIVALIVGLFAANRFSAQRARIATQTARAENAEAALAAQALLIASLQKKEASDRRLLGRLQTEQKSIAALLTRREQYLEKITQSQPEARAWADTPLPDDIARMRQRQASVTALDTRTDPECLPTSNPLSPSSGHTTDKWRAHPATGTD